MKCILLILFVFFNINSFAQKLNYLDSAFSVLLNTIYFDPIVQKSGSLLPIPNEEIFKTKKPIIIHLSIVNRKNIEIIEKIKNDFNSNISFIDSNYSFERIRNSSINKATIGTNKEIYNDAKFHVLGTIIVNGIYKKQQTSVVNVNELYFEIIRIGWASKKSQLTQIIRMCRINNKWVIDKEMISDRS